MQTEEKVEGMKSEVVFQPLQISEKVKSLYTDYILGTFPIDHPIYTDQFQKLLRHEETLSNGPYISIAKNYKRANCTPREIFKQLGVHDAVINAFPLEFLYLHQEQAIKCLCVDEKDTIVSTGTGSGKTESFLVPIINYCIKSKEKSLTGLKAIIIYPMNALANDQHERLRRLLFEINLGRTVKITFAKYTGATPRKEQIIQKPEKFPPQRCPLTDSRAKKIGCYSWCPEKIQFQPDAHMIPFGLRCQSNQEVLMAQCFS